MLFSGIPEPYKPKNRFDVIRWDYFTETLIYLQDDFTNVKPLKGMCYCYSAASPREGVGERGGGPCVHVWCMWCPLSFFLFSVCAVL